MGIADKFRLRKSSVDRNTPSSPSSVGSGFDTTGERDSPRSLPIAEQFMRSPTMPQSPSDINQGYDYRHSAPRRSASSEMGKTPFPQRKPVPSEKDRDSFDRPAETGTVRIVPNEDTDPNSPEPGQDRYGNYDIVPNFSRLNMGNPPYSEANVTADSSLEPDGGAEAHAPRAIPRSSLEKPLPAPPARETDAKDDGTVSKPYDTRGIGLASTHDLEQKLGVEGQIDLSHTEDTETQTHWAPAVTHETIIQNVHEIEEEQITRDIHEHHVFHRILPIEEVQVLPARHYVRDSNGALQEVSEQRMPRRVDKYIQKGVAKAFEKALPKANTAVGPRKFTAREFPGEVGDYKEYFTPGGPVRSDRWWVHAPTLETGGVESGQTRPFHLGSSKPEDDGWRTLTS